MKSGRTIESLVGEAPSWTADAKDQSKASKKPNAKEKPAKKSASPKRGKAKPSSPLPAFIEPCLATLVAETPSGGKFCHEIKFDGYRLQIWCDKGKVRYLSRAGYDYTDKVAPSPLHDAVLAQGWNGTIIDGELVVEGAGGLSDFSALQSALKKMTANV